MVTMRFLLTFLLLAIILVQLLFCSFFLVRNSLTLPFPGTRVVLGTLTANREVFTVTQPAVTADIHQSLDIQLHLRTKRTLHLDLLIDDVTNSTQLFVVPILNLHIVTDASLI